MKIKRKSFHSSNEISPWLAAKNYLLKYKFDFSSVALYWPMMYELDTRPLIKSLLDKGIEVALPAIKKNSLIFLKWKNQDELIYDDNKFYYPKKIYGNIIKPKIVIVPLLAYDSLGYRLGYGKGYYDRFYEQNKGLEYVGFCFAFQKTEPLPVEKYDLKLNSVITDQYIKVFN